MERYAPVPGPPLGEGTYGTVYQAWDNVGRRYVAIKRFRYKQAHAKAWRAALREAQILSSIRHENVVQLLNTVEVNGVLHMVFEFVESTLLDVLLAQTRGLPRDKLVSMTWQVVNAVCFLHTNQVVHRDIKLENVLVTATGVVKLCDFGFARSSARAAGERPMTAYIATRWYRAPELLVGDSYDAAVDVWALGCVLAELATGEPLFPGSSTLDQLWRILTLTGGLTQQQESLLASNPTLAGFRRPKPTELRSLTQRYPWLAPDVHEVVRACLQPDPARRPTCQQLLSMRLFDAIRNSSPPARPPPPGSDSSRCSGSGSAVHEAPPKQRGQDSVSGRAVMPPPVVIRPPGSTHSPQLHDCDHIAPAQECGEDEAGDLGAEGHMPAAFANANWTVVYRADELDADGGGEDQSLHGGTANGAQLPRPPVELLMVQSGPSNAAADAAGMAAVRGASDCCISLSGATHAWLPITGSLSPRASVNSSASSDAGIADEAVTVSPARRRIGPRTTERGEGQEGHSVSTVTTRSSSRAGMPCGATPRASTWVTSLESDFMEQLVPVHDQSGKGVAGGCGGGHSLDQDQEGAGAEALQSEGARIGSAWRQHLMEASSTRAYLMTPRTKSLPAGAMTALLRGGCAPGDAGRGLDCARDASGTGMAEAPPPDEGGDSPAQALRLPSLQRQSSIGPATGTTSTPYGMVPSKINVTFTSGISSSAISMGTAAPPRPRVIGPPPVSMRHSMTDVAGGSPPGWPGGVLAQSEVAGLEGGEAAKRRHSLPILAMAAPVVPAAATGASTGNSTPAAARAALRERRPSRMMGSVLASGAAAGAGVQPQGQARHSSMPHAFVADDTVGPAAPSPDPRLGWQQQQQHLSLPAAGSNNTRRLQESTRVQHATELQGDEDLIAPSVLLRQRTKSERRRATETNMVPLYLQQQQQQLLHYGAGPLPAALPSPKRSVRVEPAAAAAGMLEACSPAAEPLLEAAAPRFAYRRQLSLQTRATATGHVAASVGAGVTGNGSLARLQPLPRDGSDALGAARLKG